MDAFDADVLIYAASSGHPLGRRVVGLFAAARSRASGSAAAAGKQSVGVGSLLLLPELLSKPLRIGAGGEVAALARLLRRLDLRPLDLATAELAVALGSEHRLRAADAAHLATAVAAGADRFITNNRRDFPVSIEEIAVTYPDALPGPDSRSAVRG